MFAVGKPVSLSLGFGADRSFPHLLAHLLTGKMEDPRGWPRSAPRVLAFQNQSFASRRPQLPPFLVGHASLFTRTPTAISE
jgi:hypothetical protein